MPKKRPRKKAGKKKPTPRPAAPSKAALRFWVPPSVRATDGGVVSKNSKRPATKPKFWTPEQLGFVERNNAAVAREWDRAAWERDVQGILYSRETVERVEGVDVTCIWYGDPKIGGLAAIGYPGHATRVTAFLHGVATDYEPSAGYCVDCGTGTNDRYSEPCAGAVWALRYLERRAEVAEVLDTELARINTNGNKQASPAKGSGAERNRRANLARNTGRNAGRNTGNSGGRNHR